MTIAINGDLRGSLKAAAARDRMTMVEKLHELLCDVLDREDLKECSLAEPATTAS